MPRRRAITRRRQGGQEAQGRLATLRKANPLARPAPSSRFVAVTGAKKAGAEGSIGCPHLPGATRQRRERLESDDAVWLRWYCDDLVAGKEKCLRVPVPRNSADGHDCRDPGGRPNGGDQAIAALRGEDTTSPSGLAQVRPLRSRVLCGLFASTGSNAEDSLDAIKNTIETGERLRLDYP